MFPGLTSLTGGGGLQGGAGGSAGPSSSKLSGQSSFDSSDWTVSTGRSSAAGDIPPLVLFGAGLVVLFIVWRLTKN